MLSYQTEFVNPQAVSLTLFLEGGREVIINVYKCVQCNLETFCMASQQESTNFGKRGIYKNGHF